MNSSKGEAVKERLQVGIRLALFGGLLSFLVYYYIDPKLIFHAHGQYLAFPIQGPGMDGFSGQPVVPGSVVVHLAARLSYYLYSSWIGAALIIATGALLSAGMWVVMVSAKCGRWRPLLYVPPLIVLAQYAHYRPALLADDLALVGALPLVGLVIYGVQRRAWWALGIFIVGSVVMYVLAVQGYLVFVILVCFTGFVAHQRYALGIAAALWGWTLPGLLGRGFFLYDVPMAYRCLWPQEYEHDATWIALYGSLTGFFLVMGLVYGVDAWWNHKKRGRIEPSDERGKKAGTERRWFLHRRAVRWALGTGLLLALTVAVFALNFQSAAAVVYRINYCALTERWPQLLTAARELPRRHFGLSVCHDVDRALYHTGRLAYDMFDWPQDAAGLLLTPDKRPVGENMMFHCAKRADVLYELGHVNQAERFTCVAVELAQDHPEGLRRLAMIKAAKGQMAAARVYLQALSRDRVYRDWALQWLERMEADPNLDNAEGLQRIRSCMLIKDTVRAATPLDLFKTNLHNHMAFEYLMAFSMLTRQPEVVSTCLGYLDNFDYPKGRIPRHYEEAVLLYQTLSGKKIDLRDRKIDPKTTLRFADFLKQYQRYPADRRAAAAALAEDYGDTYYYYHLLGAPAGGNP
jgi:hypothetical protein